MCTENFGYPTISFFKLKKIAFFYKIVKISLAIFLVTLVIDSQFKKVTPFSIS